ncbi:MAG: hypothetical protein ACP5XB_00555, partial [Isosphaeraceae bacterium]
MGKAGGIFSQEIQIDVSPFVRAVRADPLRTILIVGVVLRLAAYLWNRSYWMDEGSLMGNIEGKAIFDFSSHLLGDQLAPPAFLAIERALVQLLGSSGYVTRFVPLVCGISSLWLFRSLALRWFSGSVALVGMILFTFSDDLVYYSSEVKQYSSDLLIALGLMLLASSMIGQIATGRKLVALGLLAVASPWFSFPSVFVVAGCGMTILIDRAVRGERNDLGWLLGIAVCWTVSSALAYRVSASLLNPTTTMYVFWNFAFLPVPALSRADLLKEGGILLEVFVNPLNLLPLAPPQNLLPSVPPALGVLLPLVLLVLGAASLFRRDRDGFLILSLPIACALAAAASRKFPFHGRLILELVPPLYLMIAEGTEWVRQWVGRIGYR